MPLASTTRVLPSTSESPHFVTRPSTPKKRSETLDEDEESEAQDQPTVALAEVLALFDAPLHDLDEQLATNPFESTPIDDVRRRVRELREAFHASQEANEPEPDDVLSCVAEAIAQLRDSQSYEEARDRCEALVTEVWEALGEAPEEETAEEEDDGVSFLEL